MANRIINDFGDITIAVGYEGSKARIECQYPKTIEKVFSKMKEYYTMYDGVSRHMQYSEVENICSDAGIDSGKTIGTVYVLAGERFEQWKLTI